MCGLQHQLNCLQTFCDINKLSVNIDKTKVLVFKNGGSLSRKEQELSEDNTLDVFVIANKTKMVWGYRENITKYFIILFISKYFISRKNSHNSYKNLY